MKQEILLTITMLVSNREDTIEKCMRSLKSLLENVPSELIVVDTAGNEKCMNVVKQYTDKIIPFTWCNDFSAARNTGVNAAKGKWIMFLDDDEWFESTSEIEDFFLKGTYKKYGSATYLVRNYSNKEGTKWDDRMALRIARLDSEVKFTGKIHEYLMPFAQPTYMMKDYVHHYGYVFENEQKRQEHAWRNISLLLEQRKEEPENMHAAGQLLQEYLSLNEYYSALELAKEMNSYSKRNLPMKIGYTAYSQVMEVRLYMNMGKYHVAYDRARYFLERQELLLIARGSLVGLMVGICQELGKQEEVLKYIELYEKMEKNWRSANLRHSDYFNMERLFLNENEVNRMQYIKLNVYVTLEKWSKADDWCQKIPWQETWNCMKKSTPKDLIQVLIHTQNTPDGSIAYKNAIGSFLKYDVVKNVFYGEMETVKGEDRRKVLSFIVGQKPSDLQMLHFHFEYFYLTKNKDSIIRILEYMSEKGYSYFLKDKIYWECLREMQIDMNPYMKRISIEEYFKSVENLYQEFELEVCEFVYEVLTRTVKESDIRYRYVKGLLAEKRFLEYAEKLEKSQIWENFLIISELWLSCAEVLYRPEIFKNELLTAMPGRYQFAWHILCAKERQENFMDFTRSLGEAGKSYVPMSPFITRYLRYVQEEKKQQAEYEKLTPEMRELAKMLKQKIEVLIETNQAEAAAMAIRQLEMFIPSDKELQRLKSLLG